MKGFFIVNEKDEVVADNFETKGTAKDAIKGLSDGNYRIGKINDNIFHKATIEKVVINENVFKDDEEVTSETTEGDSNV